MSGAGKIAAHSAVALLFLASCARSQPPAAAALQSPASFDDCVLAYVKPGMNSTATDAIIEACRHKFPGAKQATTSESGPWEKYQSDESAGRDSSPAALASQATAQPALGAPTQ